MVQINYNIKSIVSESLVFSGSAYLGVPRNTQLRELVFKGIEKYGLNYGASRNNDITPKVYDDAEVQAASWCGSEDAIIVSSGYLAAQLVIQHYLQGYQFIYAPDTHPALWIGKASAPLISYDQWVENALMVINHSDTPILIITHSLNNLFPQIYEFDWLSRIQSDRQVVLLIDDSHGIGITGETGEGIYSRIPQLPNIELVVVASMAKALGIDAGLILGKKKLMDQFRTSTIYAGASPPSPGFLHAYLMGRDIYINELIQLRSNVRFFTELIKGFTNLVFTENLPVYLIDDPSAGDLLRARGIIISSFAYPDPKGKPLNRIVLNSTHSEAELEQLIVALKEI